LLDVSYRARDPRRVIVYADGRDARVIRRLIERLGSEEKLHDALILLGALSEIQSGGKTGSSSRERRRRRAVMLRDCFLELVGISCEDFFKIIDDDDL
jgi:hypothetical protein